MQSAHRSHGSVRVARVTAAALAAACGVTTKVAADEWPVLRHGMWDITRTIAAPGGGEPKVVTAKRCMEPAAEWQRQNAQLSQAGCKFTPVQRSGSTYKFSSTCDVMGVSSSTTTTIVVEGDSAYTLTVDGTTDGAPTREVAKAKRVGDCKK